MKINVTTTIEIDRDLMSKDDMINKVYDEFREIIKHTHNTNDLTAFLFIDTDTNIQIEDECDEE